MNVERRYNRAYGIAEFIAEGHTMEQTKEEFRVSKDTISRDLDFLAQYGIAEQEKRNFELYKKAKIQLYKNAHKVSKK